MQYIRSEIAAPNGVPRVSLPPGKLKWKPLPKLSHDEKEFFEKLFLNPFENFLGFFGK